MAKRLTRKLTDVANEVERQLKAHFNVTEKDLTAWRAKAKLSENFPEVMQAFGLIARQN